MGVYLEIGELKRYFAETRIIDLADGDTSKTMAAQNTATKERLEACIESAESEANAYLQRRFTVPITPAPSRLKLCVGLLSMYYLFKLKPELYMDSENPFQDSYDKEIQWLTDLKDLEVEMGSNVDEANETVIFVQGNTTGLVFGGGGIDDY